MANNFGKKCVECGDRFLIGSEVNVCEKCGAVYHKHCWDALQACSVCGGTEKMNLEAADSANKNAKATAATSLKIVANLITILLGVGGGVLGCIVGPEIIGNSYFRSDPIAYLAAAAVGAVLGLGIGFIVSIFIRYLAELGENTKKTANAAMSRVTANTSTNTAQNSPQELKAYKDLLDQGVITQEEFEAKKKQILGL